MSVINKMLNDLDQRESNEDAQQEVAFMAEPARRSKKWLIGLVGSITSGILAVVIGYMYYSELLSLEKTLELLNPTAEQRNTAKPEEEMVAQTDNESTDAPDKTPEELAQSVPPQPELIVIPKKKEGETPSERTSTLSVVQVEKQPETQKPGEAAEVKAQSPGQNTQTSETTVSAQTDSKPPVQGAVDQGVAAQAVIAKSNEAKPKGLPKADETKMKISRVNRSPEQRLKKIYGAAKKLSRDGLIKEAIAKYQDALEVKPDHQESRTELAALYYGRSMVAESLGVLSQGLAIDPGNSGWSLLAAKIHYKRTNYSAALGYLQLPIHAMDQVEYVGLKAATLQKLKDYPAAAGAYRQLTAAFPENGRWWLGLATTLEAQQDFMGATSAYRKSLRLSNISQSSRQFVLSRLQQLEN